MIASAIIVGMVIFAAVFRYLNVVGLCLEMLVSARSGVAKIADRTLSDHEKERAARSASLAMAAYSLRILWLVVLALLPALAILTAMVAGGVAMPGEILAEMISWPVLLAGLGLLIVSFAAR